MLAALAFAVALTIFSIFGPTNRIVQEHRQKAIQNAPKKMLMKIVEVREMPHEVVLRKTIRDCVPSTNQHNKCKTFVPEPSTAVGDVEKVQRVAMIAPPGKLASAIRNHMRLVADQYNSRNDDGKEPKIKVIETSHVPPYGYGRSHGLTKIVKFMPQPVLLQVIDAFKALLGPKPQSINTVTLEDLQVGLLQIMRFHCRLSHVAAHTASFSIDPKTLVNHTQLGLSLRDFMAPATSTTKDVPSRDDDDAAVTADDDEMRVIYDQKSIGASILTRLSEQLTNGGATTTILELLDGVLQQEMERTKGLTAWPCPSFWEAPAPLQLSDLTKKLAAALSPDCDDPYASCFVQRDKCEAAGDAVCMKK